MSPKPPYADGDADRYRPRREQFTAGAAYPDFPAQSLPEGGRQHPLTSFSSAARFQARCARQCREHRSAFSKPAGHPGQITHSHMATITASSRVVATGLVRTLRPGPAALGPLNPDSRPVGAARLGPASGEQFQSPRTTVAAMLPVPPLTPDMARNTPSPLATTEPVEILPKLSAAYCPPTSSRKSPVPAPRYRPTCALAPDPCRRRTQRFIMRSCVGNRNVVDNAFETRLEHTRGT